MDSDDLLVEEDLLKPDPASLRSKNNRYFFPQLKDIIAKRWFLIAFYLTMLMSIILLTIVRYGR